MYLHIGMNVYLWSESIVGMFEVFLFKTYLVPFSADEEEQGGCSLTNARILSHGLRFDEAKSCILTASEEIHLSNIHCRTLEKRWNDSRRKRRSPRVQFHGFIQDGARLISSSELFSRDAYE